MFNMPGIHIHGSQLLSALQRYRFGRVSLWFVSYKCKAAEIYLPWWGGCVFGTYNTRVEAICAKEDDGNFNNHKYMGNRVCVCVESALPVEEIQFVELIFSWFEIHCF